MIITKFCYFNGRKYRYLTVGILLIGNFLGLFLIMNINNIQVLQVSSYDNNLQQGTNAQVSSKTTSIKENFNGHEYELIEEYKTWNEAKIDCESRGGYLVTITSQEENDFIEGLHGSNIIYIGLTDEVTEGEWQWVTGEALTYTNWNTGQPDNSGGAQNYGLIFGSANGLWSDAPGTVAIYYVCEFESQEISGTFKGHEYILITDLQTWINAKIDCESRGGHLVTITSQEENDFVTNLIKSDTVWIGFTDESIEGSWHWITGESVTYTNWGQNEPNDDIGEENHAEMDSSGYWNDIGGQVDSSHLLYYIYEREPVDPTFLIVGLAIIAILPEFYFFRKLKKFIIRLNIKEGVETP